MTEEDFGLFQRLPDGTMDDISGEGYWHLEKMSEGVFSFVTGSSDRDNMHWFTIYTEDGQLKVEFEE